MNSITNNKLIEPVGIIHSLYLPYIKYRVCFYNTMITATGLDQVYKCSGCKRNSIQSEIRDFGLMVIMRGDCAINKITSFYSCDDCVDISLGFTIMKCIPNRWGWQKHLRCLKCFFCGTVCRRGVYFDAYQYAFTTNTVEDILCCIKCAIKKSV